MQGEDGHRKRGRNSSQELALTGASLAKHQHDIDYNNSRPGETSLLMFPQLPLPKCTVNDLPLVNTDTHRHDRQVKDVVVRNTFKYTTTVKTQDCTKINGILCRTIGLHGQPELLLDVVGSSNVRVPEALVDPEDLDRFNAATRYHQLQVIPH